MPAAARTLLIAAAALLVAAAAPAAADTQECFNVANSLLQPASPCYQYVGEVRKRAEDMATRPCDAVNPGELPTPSPACCVAAAKLLGCECDADVHQIAGKSLTIAAVRGSQVRGEEVGTKKRRGRSNRRTLTIAPLSLHHPSTRAPTCVCRRRRADLGPCSLIRETFQKVWCRSPRA